MTPTDTEQGNGSREKIGELRGEMKMLLHDMAMLQDRHRQLQQQFVEMSQEFAVHIAGHIALDSGHKSRRENLTLWIAGASCFSGLLSATAAVVAMRVF